MQTRVRRWRQSQVPSYRWRKISCLCCLAKSSRSKLQCDRPAIKTSRTLKCQFQGGRLHPKEHLNASQKLIPFAVKPIRALSKGIPKYWQNWRITCLMKTKRLLDNTSKNSSDRKYRQNPPQMGLCQFRQLILYGTNLMIESYVPIATIIVMATVISTLKLE